MVNFWLQILCYYKLLRCYVMLCSLWLRWYAVSCLACNNHWISMWKLNWWIREADFLTSSSIRTSCCPVTILWFSKAIVCWGPSWRIWPELVLTTVRLQHYIWGPVRDGLNFEPVLPRKWKVIYFVDICLHYWNKTLLFLSKHINILNIVRNIFRKYFILSLFQFRTKLKYKLLFQWIFSWPDFCTTKKLCNGS